MRTLARFLVVCVVVGGGLLGRPSEAAAWIEKRVESSSTTIELDGAGRRRSIMSSRSTCAVRR